MNQIEVQLMFRDLQFEEALAQAIAAFGRGITVAVNPAEINVFEKKCILLTDCKNKVDESRDETLRMPVLYLTELDEQCEALKKQGVYVTEKYQSVLNILSEINMIAAEQLNMGLADYKGLGKTEIITFSAAAGGVGTTAAALAAAQYFRRYRSAGCLYISLEPWESTDRYMQNRDDKRGIEQYLYYLQEGKRTSENISAFLCRDYYGAEAFAAAAGINPLISLSSSKFAVFINHILQYGKYEYLIIDAGSNISEASIWAMENSSRNVFVSDSMRTDSKEHHFITFLEHNTAVNLTKGFMRLVNRQEPADYADFQEESEADAAKHNIHVIYEDKESFGFDGEKVRIDLDGEFGMGITRMLQGV